jgi:hypothetical protein
MVANFQQPTLNIHKLIFIAMEVSQSCLHYQPAVVVGRTVKFFGKIWLQGSIAGFSNVSCRKKEGRL